jgi:hypothetical protein
LFGSWPEIDRSNLVDQPKRGKKLDLSNIDKISRVSGLSSTDLNKATRGKSLKNTQMKSQIWF